jgi:DNA-binding NarL/FixJ family response regulator
MIKITIAETQPVYAEGLSKMLSTVTGLHLNSLTTGYQELLKTLQNEATDLLLLDAELNTNFSELLLIRQIKKEFPQLKIILFGRITCLSILFKLRKMGLDAYLYKDVSCQEFVQAILAVMNGHAYLQESISKALNCFGNSVYSKAKKNAITKREQEILELIVDEYTNQEIAQQLYISIPTVETHRKNLLLKMGVKNTAGLVREAILRQGYPFTPHGKP